MIKEGNRLDSFTQSHLVGQHDISVVLKSSQHPIQAIYLIVFTLLTQSKLGNQILLIVILEVALALGHTLELK